MYQTIARQGICISILREESPNMASALRYCSPIHRINTKHWSLVVGNTHLKVIVETLMYLQSSSRGASSDAKRESKWHLMDMFCMCMR